MRPVNKGAVAAVSSVAGFALVFVAHTAGHRSLPVAAGGAIGTVPKAPSTRGATSSPGSPTTTSPSPAPTALVGPRPLGPNPVQTSAVGNAERYGYGVMSVRVTVRGHRIIDISLANLQTAEQYSQLLAQRVVPLLRQEVLASQTAQVYGVSGATYTSEAYLYSAQSALDQLHF